MSLPVHAIYCQKVEPQIHEGSNLDLHISHALSCLTVKMVGRIITLYIKDV